MLHIPGPTLSASQPRHMPAHLLRHCLQTNANKPQLKCPLVLCEAPLSSIIRLVLSLCPLRWSRLCCESKDSLEIARSCKWRPAGPWRPSLARLTGVARRPACSKCSIIPAILAAMSLHPSTVVLHEHECVASKTILSSERSLKQMRDQFLASTVLGIACIQTSMQRHVSSKYY